MISVPTGFMLLNVLFDNQTDEKNRSSTKQVLIKKSNLNDLFEIIKTNAGQKFELIDGQIIGMSNASVWHNRIINNFGLMAGMHLLQQGSPCLFYSEVSCKIDNHNCVQPDFAIMCEKPTDHRFIENPIIIGEIFSSNKQNDTRKLPLYKQLNSVKEILYIEQNKMQISVHRRDNNKPAQWLETVYYQNDTVVLDSIDFTISVNQFYKDVEFD